MTALLTGRRILVVEDEMLLLMNIECILEDLGCTAISSAPNVSDALALLGECRFDAAMLDVNLDGATSYPVADALVKRGIPFVFATGYADHGSARIDLLDWPTLRKPYLASDLAAAFGRLLAPTPLGAAA